MAVKKQLYYFTGYFESMSTPETISKEGKPTKKRSVVKVTTEDEQTVYFEVRDAVISRIEKLGLISGDVVEIGFVFIGSEKNGRTYNNIFINQIDYAK